MTLNLCVLIASAGTAITGDTFVEIGSVTAKMQSDNKINVSTPNKAKSIFTFFIF
ncbi:MAG: hypothetical protein QXD48_02175 [Candidatus Aenigmatarchaeota archaeon]